MSPDTRAIGKSLAALSARVSALEARSSEIDRRHEVVVAAQRTWKAHTVARGSLVLCSDAGDVARVPVWIVAAMHAGQPLDVDVLDDQGDVVLVGVDGREVARVPRAAWVALPRIVASADVVKLVRDFEG